MTWNKAYPLMLCLLLLLPISTFADDKASALVADGNDWMQSASTERRAFLIGVTNMLIAEAAYAKRHGLSAPPMGAALTQGIAELKLPDIEARISAWYEAHPGERSKPVMGVLWQNIVKTQP
ncbi:MAG: hypothetical protein ACK5NQ_17590 [Pseudomonas sp.]